MLKRTRVRGDLYGLPRRRRCCRRNGHVPVVTCMGFLVLGGSCVETGVCQVAPVGVVVGEDDIGDRSNFGRYIMLCT